MEEKKYLSSLRFYLLATKLKYKIRSGWDQNHWNIKGDRLESVAEHIYGTCILAITLDANFDFDLDLDRVIKILIIHEIGEVTIGDITPFDGFCPKRKKADELAAVTEIVGDLIKKDELISLFKEFDEQETKEAKFAYLCDKLEANIQAKVYQDMNLQRELDDQANNVVFKRKEIQELLNNGAKKPWDIWREWDKEKYTKDKVFSKLLEYVDKENTNI